MPETQSPGRGRGDELISTSLIRRRPKCFRGAARAPLTPTLSPGKPGEREPTEGASLFGTCAACPLSPGSAGGEGWGEGALLTPQPTTQTPARKYDPPSPCSQCGTPSTSTIGSPAKPGEGGRLRKYETMKLPQLAPSLLAPPEERVGVRGRS